MIRIKNNLTPRLPNEYQELEYIQSTGTQYIDTGVNADYKLSLKFNAQVTDISSKMDMGAIYHLSDNNYIRHHFNTENDGLRYWYDGNYYSDLIYTSSASILKKKYDYTIDIYNNQLSSSYGKSFTISRENFDCQISYWLFKRNSNNVALQTNMKMKLYSCQMYYEDTLIRNFIPCYRKSDNEIGLYDLVNNQFYTNAGTGVFLMGTEVNKADVNLKPIIGNKKVLKRYIGENLVYGKETMSDIIVTREILDKGTFRNVAPVYLTNQIDSSDGFTIVGRGNVSSGSNQWEKYLAWTYTIDLTDYINIKFYAKKNANHGTVLLAILDEIKSGVSPLKSVGKGYASCPITWTEYELDVSDLVGTKTLFFLGGYYDMTGKASSSTSYCNIRILK